jgi:urate oxidase
MTKLKLGRNVYGKSAIRLVKVIRDPDQHVVRDLTVAIALEGDFAASYVDGDNALVIATDTMKNTTYALAAEHLTGPIEAFATVLGGHFLGEPQVDIATVTIEEHRWAPIGHAPDAFLRDPGSIRTAVVAATRSSLAVDAGIDGLTVMKTAHSGFSGFPRDAFTTLPETDDRILATKITATWRYGSQPDYDKAHAAIVETLLRVFTNHDSRSVQETIWLIGRAIVERHHDVDEITITMPNLHHLLVDLSPFGFPNDRQIFVSTTEPHGLIQATIRRGE